MRRTVAAGALSAVLAFGGVACSDEDEERAEEIGDEVEDRARDAQEEVEDQIDEGTEEQNEGGG